MVGNGSGLHQSCLPAWPGGTKENHESQYPGRDLSPKPSKYETGVIDNHWEFCSVK
jgi:hypothetical protein